MAGEWAAQLPEDLRANEILTGYATLGDFAKAHLETQGKVTELDGKVKEYEGKITDLTTSSIQKLPENATQEQRDTFYKSLGRPEKPDEYEIAQPAEGKIDENLSTAAKIAFHANGLNKEQAKGMSAWFNTYVGEVAKAETAQREKARNDAEVALKAELGDKYDATVEMVKRVWSKHSNSEFDAFVNETKIGNDPRLIKFMMNISKLTGEDKSPMGNPGKGGTAKPGIIYDKSNMPPAKT